MIPFPDIGPNIVTIPLFGREFSLRWYAMAYLVGLLAGWWLVARLMRRPRLWGDAPPFAPARAEDLLTWIVLGVVLGGRLGFVLFYQPAWFFAHPGEIVKVWQGGMSFHGGFLGVVVAAALWARRNRVEAVRLADALCAVAPVGLFFGRLANFINAELWGRPTTMPWGVLFPGEAAQACATAAGPCARHPSQLYEAGLEGLVLGLVLWWLVRRGALRRPGMIFGAFLAGYGLARIVVELFREADGQFVTPDNPMGHVIGGAGLGLSMGQLLSVPMVLVGLALIARARRNPPRSASGLGAGPAGATAAAVGEAARR